jgi:MFS family permease
MSRKSFLIAMFGVIVQYYDYHLFGFLASKISKYFIPASNTTVQLLNTYFIMAIAVAAKPVGALVLGRIGDIYGRFVTLNLSLLGTSAASLIVSIIPGYSHIGVMSALMLLIARMCTCAFASSGTDGVRLFIYEHIGKDKQCLGNGLIVTSTLLGSFLASVSAWFFTMDIFPSYSWRGAFLLGSILGVMMVIIRKKSKNDDSNLVKLEPDYSEFKDKSLTKIISNNSGLFLVCAILAGCIGSTNQFYLIFFGTYNFDVIKVIPQSTMQSYTSIAIVVYIIFSIIGGIAADKLGRLRVFNISFIALILVSVLMTVSMSSKSGAPNYIFYFLSMAIGPLFIMPALAFLKQSIPVVIRYRIFSLAHAIGSICISAPTAFVSTLMYHKTNIAWFPLIYFITTVIVIAICVNILCKKYNANDY